MNHFNNFWIAVSIDTCFHKIVKKCVHGALARHHVIILCHHVTGFLKIECALPLKLLALAPTGDRRCKNLRQSVTGLSKFTVLERLSSPIMLLSQDWSVVLGEADIFYADFGICIAILNWRIGCLTQYRSKKMASDFGELVLVVGDYHIPHRASGIPVSFIDLYDVYSL